MTPTILQYIRNASDTTLINIVIDLAVNHEELFVELAGNHGLEETYEFDFPHARERISAKLLLEIKKHCADCSKVAGIKAYRMATGASLYDAKHAVEYLIEQGITPIGHRPDVFLEALGPSTRDLDNW